MSPYTGGTGSKFHNFVDKLLKLPTETYVEPWHLLPWGQKDLSSLNVLLLLPWTQKEIVLDWQIV